MLRVGEITLSHHVMKACDTHFAKNKDKLMIMLYSSKTHSTGMRPQHIKITSNKDEKTGSYAKRIFCPFKLVNDYMTVRGNFLDQREQFFVFRDRSPVTPNDVRNVTKKLA